VLICFLTKGDTTRIYRSKFLRKGWQLLGEPEALTFGTSADAFPSVAAGKIAFQSGVSSGGVWSLPADTNQGRTTGNLEKLTVEKTQYAGATLTADGNSLLYRTQFQNIILRDLATGKERTLLSKGTVINQAWISADGSSVVYTSFQTPTRLSNVYELSVGGGPPRKICDDCGPVRSLTPDGKQFLATRMEGSRPQISLVSVESGHSTVLLQHPRYNLDAPRFSPDGKWIAFQMAGGGSVDIVVAPFRGAAAIPESEWTTVNSEPGVFNNAFWSPDGGLLYYMKRGAGPFYLMARRLDSNRHPQGLPIEVYQFTERVRPRLVFGDSFTAGPGRIVGSMLESNNNIWLLDLPK
jgi:dipeptidyl aminopeptidase/acylaminoacyl peptidase